MTCRFYRCGAVACAFCGNPCPFRVFAGCAVNGEVDKEELLRAIFAEREEEKKDADV